VNCSTVLATPFGVPDVPWGLNALSGNAQASLSWNVTNYSGPGTLTYHLFRDNVEVWSGSATSHDDVGLVNGQTYRYKVAASNSAGESALTEEVLATPTTSGPSGISDMTVIIAMVAVITITGIGAALLFIQKK
jgi:hypothetical protein